MLYANLEDYINAEIKSTIKLCKYGLQEMFYLQTSMCGGRGLTVVIKI
jgi:hypothetical protein